MIPHLGYLMDPCQIKQVLDILLILFHFLIPTKNYDESKESDSNTKYFGDQILLMKCLSEKKCHNVRYLSPDNVGRHKGVRDADSPDHQQQRLLQEAQDQLLVRLGTAPRLGVPQTGPARAHVTAAGPEGADLNRKWN